MKISYTKHAKEMLVKRGIEKNLVEKTIKEPDFKLAGKEGKKIYLKDLGNNYLKVILAEETKELVVITFYWLAKKEFKKEQI